ncbi:MAG: hypothetical protein WDO24_28165 [Pseudomonadota bacterium]
MAKKLMPSPPTRRRNLDPRQPERGRRLQRLERHPPLALPARGIRHHDVAGEYFGALDQRGFVRRQ